MSEIMLEDCEFIGGGPLDGAIRSMQAGLVRIEASEPAPVPAELPVDAPWHAKITHVYLRFGPRRDGGAYYRYRGIERSTA